MKSNRSKAIVGLVLVCAAVLAAGAGIFLSLSRKDPGIFRICSVPVSVLLVAGGVLLSRSIRWTGGRPAVREEPLPKEVTATVLGVTRGLRMEGGKPQYYVLCRYKDEKTGREATFTSDPLEEYPGKEIIGQQVTVYVESYEDGKYRVDLESRTGKSYK